MLDVCRSGFEFCLLHVSGHVALDKFLDFPESWILGPGSSVPLCGLHLGFPLVHVLKGSQSYHCLSPFQKKSGIREPWLLAQTWVKNPHPAFRTRKAFLVEIPPTCLHVFLSFVHSFIDHSFNKYLFHTFSEPGTVLDPEATGGTETLSLSS